MCLVYLHDEWNNVVVAWLHPWGWLHPEVLRTAVLLVHLWFHCSFCKSGTSPQVCSCIWGCLSWFIFSIPCLTCLPVLFAISSLYFPYLVYSIPSSKTLGNTWLICSFDVNFWFPAILIKCNIWLFLLDFLRSTRTRTISFKPHTGSEECSAHNKYSLAGKYLTLGLLFSGICRWTGHLSSLLSSRFGDKLALLQWIIADDLVSLLVLVMAHGWWLKLPPNRLQCLLLV